MTNSDLHHLVASGAFTPDAAATFRALDTVETPGASAAGEQLYEALRAWMTLCDANNPVRGAAALLELNNALYHLGCDLFGGIDWAEQPHLPAYEQFHELSAGVSGSSAKSKSRRRR